MRRRRSAAPIILIMILLLLVAVGVIWILTSEKIGGSPAFSATPAPTATVEPTAEPTAAPTATPEPTPTATPAPTPTASPSPSPSPTPTATPEPTVAPGITYDTSGEFRSDTGTWLNLVVKWGAYTDAEGKLQLKLEAYTSSYALYTSARSDDVVYKVGSQAVYGSSPAINCDATALTETYLSSQTVEIEPNTDIPLSVTWYFNGTYSNQNIGGITAEATIRVPG